MNVVRTRRNGESGAGAESVAASLSRIPYRQCLVAAAAGIGSVASDNFIGAPHRSRRIPAIPVDAVDTGTPVQNQRARHKSHLLIRIGDGIVESPTKFCVEQRLAILVVG